MAKAKILLVDDEPDFVELMSVRITSWGYAVVLAKSGRDAVETFKSQHPDIVILDFALPDMDGASVLKKLRKIDKKIPVVMFTAHSDIKVQKDIEKLGVSAFVPKLSFAQDEEEALKSAIEIIVRSGK